MVLFTLAEIFVAVLKGEVVGAYLTGFEAPSAVYFISIAPEISIVPDQSVGSGLYLVVRRYTLLAAKRVFLGGPGRSTLSRYTLSVVLYGKRGAKQLTELRG
ncbi:hypothetical protein BHM03_00028285 [Ensete ventricosum]|nr:hypothetical protein BHM03_00028285 [Ensete ventricosum]